MTDTRLCELLLAAGYQPESYSGRGMFGKQCVGVRTDWETSVFKLAIELAQASLDDAVGSSEKAEEQMELYHEELHALGELNIFSDSMGRGGILYFPKVEWTREKAED